MTSDLLRVGVYTDPRDRSRPYHVTRAIGSIVRVERFATEAEQRRAAFAARADLALLSEAMQRGQHRARRLAS